MKKIAIVLLCFFIKSTQAQPTVSVWDRGFTAANSGFRSLQQTADGGFIFGASASGGIVGDKTEPSRGGSDYWIIKTDANGIIEFDKVFGGLNTDFLTVVRQTPDGGYIVGGSSNSPVSGEKSQPTNFPFFDVWLVKMDAVGNLEWERTYGGNDRDVLGDLEVTSDGGYILGVSSKSGVNSDKSESNRGEEDYWIVKLDANGNIQWDKTYGGTENDRLHSIKQTSDGGYIFGGGSHSGISGERTQPSRGNQDFWVVKTDANGDKQWDKRFGSNFFDIIESLAQTADGGYILAGVSGPSGINGDKTENNKGSSDYWVVKIDPNGTKVWDHTYGGLGQDNLFSLWPTSDGNYVVAGSSQSPVSGDKTEPRRGSSPFGPTDYWIVKIDDDGGIIWDKTLGGSSGDNPRAIQQTSDEGYIVGGSSTSSVGFDKTAAGGMWVVKFFEQCTVACGTCTDLSGTVYIDDVTVNCALDPGETSLGLGNIIIQADDGINKCFTKADMSGNYTFQLPASTYTVSLISNNIIQESSSCGSLNYHVVLNAGVPSIGNDFFVESTQCDITSKNTVGRNFPSNNAINVLATASIEVEYFCPINPSSVILNQSFVVRGTVSGLHSGILTIAGNDRLLTYIPNTPFASGETVTVIATNGISGVGTQVVAPFIFEFTVASDPSPGLFSAPIRYQTGNSPVRIGAGDFDGDGFSDLAISNEADNSISVLLNDAGSPGAFLPKVDYPTVASPYDVQVADLNSDNFMDIVVSHRVFSGNFSVFLNSGSGTFPVRTDYFSGHSAQSVDIQDINADGILDLIISHSESPYDAVSFIGIGNGIFEPGVRQPIHSHIKSGLLKDLDNDGDMDIITSNNFFSIRSKEGNGDGTFKAKREFSGVTRLGSRSNAGTMVSTDFDGDGDLDVLVGTRALSNSISLFSNKGNGYFNSPNVIEAGQTPHHVSTADIDGDGDMDIVATHVLDNKGFGVSVLKNNGDGTFLDAEEYISDDGEHEGLVLCDIDNNGTADLIVTNRGSATISVLKNVKTPTFIEGIAFNDVDGNQTQGLSEFPMVNWPITLSPNNISTYTNGNGEYRIVIGDEDTYTVSEQSDPFWQQTFPSGGVNHTLVVSSLGQTLGGNDFGFQRQSCGPCLTSTIDIDAGLFGFPCPGNELCYNINVDNDCNEPVDNFCVELTLDYENFIQSLTATTSSCPPGVTCEVHLPSSSTLDCSNLTGYTCIFDLPAASTDVIFSYCKSGILSIPGSFAVDVCVRLFPVCPAPCSAVCPPFTGACNPLPPNCTPSCSGVSFINADLLATGDALTSGCPATGSASSNEDTNCSLDPNNKLVVAPEGCGPEHYIELQDTITYRINFQNIGTAPATKVVIVDSLDTDLDTNTFVFLASSHPVSFQF